MSGYLTNAGVCDLWCEGCDFLPKEGTVFCDFLLTAGRRRGCPAGTGCTARRRPSAYKKDRRLLAYVADLQEAAKAEAQKQQKTNAPKDQNRLRGDSPSLNESSRWVMEQKRRERARRRPEMVAQSAAISAWRKDRGLTRQAAGELLGVTGSALGTWERGEVVAQWDRLEKAGCRKPESAA